ncbi:MAG: hypothetical protein ACOX52_15910 [Verrucomicrobiota bacterium]
MVRSNFAAELCQYRNNTDLLAGFSCPNPIPRIFDTETDSDPDPDRASPLTFSDSVQPMALGFLDNLLLVLLLILVLVLVPIPALLFANFAPPQGPAHRASLCREG